jgi:hypothetical protein
VLTEDGLSRLREAASSHEAVIEQMLEAHLAEKQIEALTQILERLPGASDEPCTVEDE